LLISLPGGPFDEGIGGCDISPVFELSYRISTHFFFTTDSKDVSSTCHKLTGWVGVNQVIVNRKIGQLCDD
jgi:hypothetical protein